ncbi:hypothetical protein roselon_02438 [Roseibacterium elongatum DSM 19469]|uniref:L-alanine exporter AlaE n=1 Tax=Roseicyclus elongatus DSM 19469 TaxID=1294273 RepID=W8RU57_9RHOB|nr:hypothetical protein roselon_02438 [Roseibacterium elongatum DSM 19469]
MVDTGTTIVFFTIVAGLTELLLAGMSPREVLVTRALTVPVMVLTGRPYGMWRDMWFRRVPARGLIARTALDIAAFLSFQVPVYAMILWVAGADVGEMAIALGSAVWLMVLLSRPFGLVLERVRRAFGLAPPGLAHAPDR